MEINHEAYMKEKELEIKALEGKNERELVKLQMWIWKRKRKQ